MQIVLDDKLIQEIKKETDSEDIITAIKKILKEYKSIKQTKKVANDINQAIDDIKKGKVYSIQSVLNEI
jgi:galactitol-specific phosphotransferase system IIB component